MITIFISGCNPYDEPKLKELCEEYGYTGQLVPVDYSVWCVDISVNKHQKDNSIKFIGRLVLNGFDVETKE